MGLFGRLFGNAPSNEVQPDIRFGRYTDAYKTDEQYDAWDRALMQFEEQNYLTAYREFFDYLRDQDAGNVRYWMEGEELKFELFQGSKRITGFANKKQLGAKAKIALSEDLNIGFMQRLLQQNHDLKYSRYTLDGDHHISILFDSFTLDGSPYKLYYALKELATSADKQDDLLIDEFRMLKPVETDHLQAIPDKEKEVKYQFMRREIGAVLDGMDNGQQPVQEYPGGVAYLILHLSYKLDYLISPEGFMMETLERIHRRYFEKAPQSSIEKNKILYNELRALYERPKAALFKEMYRVPSTFGITSPVNHDRVEQFIQGELGNMDWYLENGYEEIALGIPGYIVGYCLFNYAIPKPDRDFFHLFYQITEPDYFSQLGFSLRYYDSRKKQFNKRAIRRAIREVVEQNRDIYYKLHPNTAILEFDHIAKFARSYLLMVRELDLSKN
ncbi:MAG: hypothetical protein AAFP19_19540 [Bacteroidota bacterium]